MNAEVELNSFIDRYSPEVAADARRAVEFLTARLPTATRLVYDNYNALVVAFAGGGKGSAAFLSIALYPRYVTLFFSSGALLSDPHGLLQGRGSSVRSIRLQPITRLQSPEVGELIEAAIAGAPPLPHAGEGKLIIKSVSGKQRPRRPSP
jgi:hypothetical protein